MTGSLSESHYEVVKEKHESDQQRLANFSNESQATTIAVVSRPNQTKIDDICDEHISVLGMPERHLSRFHKYKSGFQTNSAVDNPVQRAYDEARLDYHYTRHIQCSDEAQTAIDELVSRLEEGEDLCLVCFEKPGEPCHRHKLMQIVQSRLDSDFTFGDSEKITV
jgi:hypothetical protein